MWLITHIFFRWNIESRDMFQKVDEYWKTCKYLGGYPDETIEEVEKTIAMAKEHMAAGLDSAHFLCVIPLPGTPFFDLAMKEGYLPTDYDIDKMHWQKANMINTTIPPHELEKIRQKAWEDTNHEWYQLEKKKLVSTDAVYRDQFGS
jgi:anaerobic magnesium-protoporphyrin IX monomethyl ester cyclase